TTLIYISAFVLATSVNAWGQFTPGNLVVLKNGDGSTAPTSSATVISLLEFTTAGVATGAGATFPSTTPPYITNSGSASTEGQIGLSAEQDRILVAGFNAIAGTPSITSSSSAS